MIMDPRPWTRRGTKGQFIRTRQIWTPESWDAGWKNRKGRHCVYRPDYPGGFKSGYAFRSHIVWWLRTGRIVERGYVLHHWNEISDDDRYDNLEYMAHGDHTRLHQKRELARKVCAWCAGVYRLENWRLKEPARRFCSHSCATTSRHYMRRIIGILRGATTHV